MINNKIKVLDIGHSNLTLDQAQMVLETTISQLAFEGSIRVIKVITGHGSGKLRGSIRSWCGNQEGRFQAVINGEDYNVFNKVAADMRADINIHGDMDFGRNNTGVTYIWLW